MKDDVVVVVVVFIAPLPKITPHPSPFDKLSSKLSFLLSFSFLGQPSHNKQAFTFNSLAVIKSHRDYNYIFNRRQVIRIRITLLLGALT